MFIIKIALVAAAALMVLFLLSQNTEKWALKLQKYYIDQSNRLYGNNGGWDKPWRLTLFKVLVIFFGLMAILGVYVTVYSL